MQQKTECFPGHRYGFSGAAIAVKSLAMGLVTITVTGLVMTATLSSPSRAQTQSATLNALREAHRAAFDARALQMLSQMTDAYAELESFAQKTEFALLQTPVVPEGFKISRPTSANTDKSNTATSLSTPSSTPSTSSSTNSSTNLSIGSTTEEGTLPRTPVEKSLMHTVRLMVTRPNLLRVETSEYSETAGDWKTSASVSDGKTFWTYDAEKKWYTQTKAPSTLRGFQKVALGNTTLELMMILGYAPFTQVDEQFDSARYEGVQLVRGVQTDVVCLRAANDQQIQELRFFLGPENHLLYRLVIETIPIVKPIERPKRDPLDDLIAHPNPVPSTPQIPVASGFEDPRPIAPAGSPMRIRLTIDNSFETEPAFSPNTFRFVPPKEASLYQGLDGGTSLGGLQNQKAIEALLNGNAKPGKTRSTKPPKIRH